MSDERYANQTEPIRYCTIHSTVFEKVCPECQSVGSELPRDRWSEICEVCEENLAAWKTATGTLVCGDCLSGAPTEELPATTIPPTQPQTNDVQVQAIRFICDAIVESVAVAGSMGAPGGVLYAALMGSLSFDQFEGFMSGLVMVGRLRKQGELYFVGENR